MTFIHDLDNSQDSQAIQEFMEQGRDLIKNPEQLADLTKAREAFNQALLTGTGTVGSLLTHKGLAGIKKKALDPLVKKGMSLLKQTKDAVGDRIQAARTQVQNEVDSLPERVGARIAQQGVDGGPETGDAIPRSVGELNKPTVQDANGTEFDPQSLDMSNPDDPKPFPDDEVPGKFVQSQDVARDGYGNPYDPNKVDVSSYNEPVAVREEGEFEPEGGIRELPVEAPRAGPAIRADEPLGAGATGETAAATTGETAATTATTTAATTAATTGETVGEDVGRAAAKAAATTATTDAELGGPGDIAGDVISLLAGLGTVFAGLGAQEKAPEPTLLRQVQPTVQRGLAGY